MSNTSTLYPFRQALKGALRGLILTSAVPLINAALTANLTGNVNTALGATIPQFGDATVVTGEQSYVDQECIITVETVAETYGAISNDHYGVDFTSSIKLKAPLVGDNAPEDYALIGDIVIDNLRDVFMTAASNVITPQNSSGQALLPNGGTFYLCRIVRCIGPIIKTAAAAGTHTRGGQEWWQWEITHVARTDFYLGRPLTYP